MDFGSVVKSMLIGLMAGLSSGAFGIGGGVLVVPLQVIVLKVSIKEAVRVSLGVVFSCLR